MQQRPKFTKEKLRIGSCSGKIANYETGLAFFGTTSVIWVQTTSTSRFDWRKRRRLSLGVSKTIILAANCFPLSARVDPTRTSISSHTVGRSHRCQRRWKPSFKTRLMTSSALLNWIVSFTGAVCRPRPTLKPSTGQFDRRPQRFLVKRVRREILIIVNIINASSAPQHYRHLFLPKFSFNLFRVRISFTWNEMLYCLLTISLLRVR